MADTLAASIKAMAAEGRALRTHLTEQQQPCFVTEAYLDAMVAHANAFLAAGDAAANVLVAAHVARSDQAWWQGAWVWFLSTVVTVFGRANAVDASVPKITPRQLRSALTPHATRKRSSKKKSTEGAQASDAKKTAPSASKTEAKHDTPADAPAAPTG
jgi:hypothetical protein